MHLFEKVYYFEQENYIKHILFMKQKSCCILYHTTNTFHWLSLHVQFETLCN